MSFCQWSSVLERQQGINLAIFTSALLDELVSESSGDEDSSLSEGISSNSSNSNSSSSDSTLLSVSGSIGIAIAAIAAVSFTQTGILIATDRKSVV